MFGTHINPTGAGLPPDVFLRLVMWAALAMALCSMSSNRTPGISKCVPSSHTATASPVLEGSVASTPNSVWPGRSRHTESGRTVPSHCTFQGAGAHATEPLAPSEATSQASSALDTSVIWAGDSPARKVNTAQQQERQQQQPQQQQQHHHNDHPQQQERQ